MLFSVLGSSGVIGRRLTHHLRQQGHEVYLPSRGDGELFRRPLGHVIYAIGITSDFRSRPLDTVEAHVCALLKILRVSDFESFQYLSSTRIYSEDVVGREGSSLKVNPANPSDLYSLSKLLGESVCLTAGRENVRVSRLSNVVGGDDADSENFLPSLLKQARAGHIVLRTSLNSSKDYVHIDDVVELLSRISLCGKASIYNVASGRQLSHLQWIERLVAFTGCSYEVMLGAKKTCFAPVDISLVREEFGFQPRDALNALILPNNGN